MYAIYEKYGDNNLYAVVIPQDSKHIFDEIKGEYPNPCFYTYKQSVVRDGDDGVYLSNESQAILLELFDRKGTNYIPEGATSLKVQLIDFRNHDKV